MSEASKPFTIRLVRSAHAPLQAVAKYHHRSQANTLEWLVTEEYRRLIKAGEIEVKQYGEEAHP
jgi:hypothetical protein